MARARLSFPPDPLDRLVGEAPALQTLRAQIRHLARFDAVGHAAVPTVLLQGETGTGKGLVARVIHDSGPRASGPLIEVNCAAIPEALLEAELFGFEAGAFTDAKRAKPGLFEAASGGTLFLDEIDALPLPIQGKFLTAIEAKHVRRVGAVVEQPMDVKLIAATQVELSGHVQAGRFRADLYHRLAVVVLELPPLRERGEDILVLARTFLQQYGVAYGVGPQHLSKAAEAWLLSHRWPGNVRELSHLLERIVLLESATVIDPKSAAQGQSTEGIAQMRQGMEAHRSMGAMMRPYDLALLAAAYGWIGQTAEALRLLDEALALTHQFGGHFYQAEVYRLTGEIQLMQDAGGGMSGSPPAELSMMDGHEGETTGPSPRIAEAETWFRQALDIARRQQAKSLELRATMSLSRLWQRQDKRSEAYQLLASIYGWFTEGFDTADLQEAKVLLDDLS